jgi:6,7-dimethyl-8-ribityllumazine synthase
VAAFGWLKKFKMVAVAMVTKMQKMLNSLQTSQSFPVMFPVISTSSGTREAKTIGIGRTNFAAVAMEIKKKGDLEKNVDFFHQTS